ncbi:MAG: patatin-like phospholipase family protein [Parachlamydiaceae bacterium]|nr:patatin-like phospholipase family protein [Parachlamydiaceae bacterium]
MKTSIRASLLNGFAFAIISTLLLVSCGTKYKLPEEIPPLPVLSPHHHVRLALVLGGGGARGMAHVGVLEEFERAGIKIDMIVGCSAGSIVGALYADCPNARHVKHLLVPLKVWDILDVTIKNARYGFVQGRSLRKFLNKNLHCERFEDLHIPLYVVATDMMEGRLVTFSYGPIIPAVHASAAVPFVFAPVLVHGRILVDGGVADPIPVCVAKSMNADVIVAVDLSELLEKACPTNLFGVAARSAEIKFLLQTESCAQDADVIIKPELGDIGMFDDKNHENMYQAGRKAAREAMPKILAELEKYESQGAFREQTVMEVSVNEPALKEPSEFSDSPN